MKKLFSAFTAVLLAFCFISCAPQELSDCSSKNEGSVSLSIRSPRTISPAEGISYKNVEKWTVTFQDITAKYDVITVENVNFNSSPQEIRLPLGTYNVTLNGTAKNSTSDETATAQTVTFYGEASVTVDGDTPVPISVFVAPKQSGTGSFNFTVTTRGFGSYPPDSSDSSSFIVSLTPFGGEIPVATWTPTVDHKFENNVEIYSFSVSSATLESQSVPSGFYTLSIKYTWDVYVEGIPLTKTKEIYYPNHDFLVEIIDGLTTTGSADIIVSTEESKTYYATTDAEAKGNGAFASMPGYLDNVLDAVNRTTISTANIYMVDSLDSTTLTITYPEIDVSKVNATGKTYKIYTKNKDSGSYEAPCYTITGAAVKGGEPTIYIDSSVRTVTLKNSQSSSGISGRAKIVALENPEFVLKDNTSVFIDLTDVQYTITDTTICMPDSTYNSYYAEHPCVTCVTKDNPNFQVVLERQLLTSYSVVTKSSDDEINKTKTTDFYIIPSYKAGLSVEGIPKYSLVATTKYGSVTADTPLYAGDTVTVTATPQGSFAEGTTFAWFINGEQRDCTKNSYEITFGDNAVANNTIICLAEYKGRYATAGIDLNNIRDMTTLLYNNNYMTYGLAYSILGAPTFDSSYILSNSEFYEGYDSFPDFCIDAYNNVYSIFKDRSGRYKISKASSSEEYLDITDYSYSGNGTPSLIKMGNDGKLYVVDSNNQFGIVTFSTDAASGNSASVNLLINPSDFGSSSEEILSFCVDSQGFIYVTYKVVSNGSTNIILSKFTNTGNVLSMDSSQSKTLFEITGTDTTITVSSGYFDLPNYIYSNITITDMHCEGDYIYLIMRDVMDSGSPSEFHSLGGVCTISTDLSLPTEKKQFVGWASDIVNTTGDGETAIYTYKHDDCFYGPQKIIAIKPKEIILADDGVYIENNVKLNKNRVVVFNLFDNSISKSYDAPADIDFECSTSGPYNGQ
ncbi:MAG: hypothetical protein PUI78_04270 [Treponema sp.]|nr:hypothetical protein [Treponema sp.]